MTMRFRRALEPKDLATTKRNYYNTDGLKISTLEESLATAELNLTSDYTSPVHVEETPAAGQMLMLSTGATRSVSRRLHLFILLLLSSSCHVLHAQEFDSVLRSMIWLDSSAYQRCECCQCPIFFIAFKAVPIHGSKEQTKRQAPRMRLNGSLRTKTKLQAL
ncbi:hypothetical protein NHX12_017577 [Muraenolepis orangiensis]|uniref:Uncharacterized protein n=1 Tax=Muraenolepis orangiensis TaxID=630683 RepID=A0A9Q0EY52_9TELE|nr:hypothetical protein NHX12_017577 [Muraenolepis orangiensis]